MRDKPAHPVDQADVHDDESFLQRFSRLKTEARRSEPDTEPTAAAQEPDDVPVVEPEPPGDDDMPPIDTLTVDSDYSGFFSPKVSDTLRKAALRKLFHSAQFNVIDELDDYAEDFTTFQSLGDIVTADMKHQLEMQAKRAADALKHELIDDTEPTQDAQAVAASDTPEAPATNRETTEDTNADHEKAQG